MFNHLKRHGLLYLAGIILVMTIMIGTHEEYDNQQHNGLFVNVTK